jgi:hypothetical protein
VIAALAIARRRGGRPATRPALVAAATYAGTALAVGGWWWVRNLALYRAISPSKVDGMVPAPEHLHVDWGGFLDKWGYLTTQRFWGDFAGAGAHMPALAFVPATAVVLVAIAYALRPRDRVGATPRSERLLLAGPLVLLAVTQFAFAFRGYLKTGLFPGMQGRYLFGAVASTSIVVAIGLANLLRAGARRWLPLGVLGIACVLHGLSIVRILGYFWEDAGSSLGDQVRAMMAWAPLPGPPLAVGTAVGAAALGATVAQVARPGRPVAPLAPPDDDEPDIIEPAGRTPGIADRVASAV